MGSVIGGGAEILGNAKCCDGEALAIYRLVQEGLTNASRHSGASQIEISIDYLVPGHLRIGLADNGQGALAAIKPGMGLLGLAERFRLLGGSLKFGARDLGGFALEGRLKLT